MGHLVESLDVAGIGHCQAERTFQGEDRDHGVLPGQFLRDQRDLLVIDHKILEIDIRHPELVRQGLVNLVLGQDALFDQGLVDGSTARFSGRLQLFPVDQAAGHKYVGYPFLIRFEHKSYLPLT